MLATLLKIPRIGVLVLATWKITLGKNSALLWVLLQGSSSRLAICSRKLTAIVAKAAVTQRVTVRRKSPSVPAGVLKYVAPLTKNQ